VAPQEGFFPWSYFVIFILFSPILFRINCIPLLSFFLFSVLFPIPYGFSLISLTRYALFVSGSLKKFHKGVYVKMVNAIGIKLLVSYFEKLSRNCITMAKTNDKTR
jgi:hypothetical protein